MEDSVEGLDHSCSDVECLVLFQIGSYLPHLRSKHVMKMYMDPGSMISSQITQIAQSNSSRLGFPALITTLCDAKRVISDTLTFESLIPVINLAYIRKNCWNLVDPSIVFPGP